MKEPQVVPMEVTPEDEVMPTLVERWPRPEPELLDKQEWVSAVKKSVKGVEFDTVSSEMKQQTKVLLASHKSKFIKKKRFGFSQARYLFCNFLYGFLFQFGSRFLSQFACKIVRTD